MDKEKSDKAILELAECREMDTESGHEVGDSVLTALLTQLGYVEVVEEYEKIKKWFA